MLNPPVPRSLLTTDRAEHDALPLEVLEGTLPGDLRGHLYMVTPASTVGSEPGVRDTTLMVGDGLVCRFDLSPAGVRLTSRIPRTPDLVADELTATRPELEDYRFFNAGLVRIGRLGSRDFVNTAFLPVTPAGQATRMLLTYDAGRPIEIDPVTLELASPVGHRHEWRAEALPDAVFPVVLSPAHPAYDARSGELFTLNYGRGVLNILNTIPVVAALRRIPRGVEAALDKLATVAGVDRAYRWLERRLERLTTRLDRRAEALADRFLPSLIPDTFTDLVRWDTEGALERWRLVLPSGREVSIKQSVHQIAVTREHVVVLETGFKIGLQSGFDDPIPHGDVVERALRAILTRPQLPTTTLYVVPRASLNDSAPVGDDGVRRVECTSVSFPLESDHFVADYDDADGRITVHLAHSPATDLSEWIRAYDISAYDGSTPPAALRGMLAVGAMDVGRFGRYVIGADGSLLDAKTSSDERTSWALALYAGAGLNTDRPLPERIEQIYWCSEGCFPQLLTEFVFDLYEEYPHRQVPLSTIREMGPTGRPSAIHRIDTRTLTIADRLVLPDGVMAGSLQYVPRGDGPTDGYLVGTIYTDARTELWVLDAADLAAGPLCRLGSDEVRLGFSLHTAWLSELSPRTSTYRVPVRGEVEAAVRALDDPQLESAFEAEVYPILDS